MSATLRPHLTRVWLSLEGLVNGWDELERHLDESDEREIRLLAERFRDMWLCSTREENLRHLFAQLGAAKARAR